MQHTHRFCTPHAVSLGAVAPSVVRDWYVFGRVSGGKEFHVDREVNTAKRETLLASSRNATKDSKRTGLSLIFGSSSVICCSIFKILVGTFGPPSPREGAASAEGFHDSVFSLRPQWPRD